MLFTCRSFISISLKRYKVIKKSQFCKNKVFLIFFPGDGRMWIRMAQKPYGFNRSESGTLVLGNFLKSANGACIPWYSGSWRCCVYDMTSSHNEFFLYLMTGCKCADAELTKKQETIWGFTASFVQFFPDLRAAHTPRTLSSNSRFHKIHKKPPSSLPRTFLVAATESKAYKIQIKLARPDLVNSCTVDSLNLKLNNQRRR